MRVYTYSEARQRFADVLQQAALDGEVRIRRRDGQVFTIRPESASGSPLDVPGVRARCSAREIVDWVRDGRRSTNRFLK